VTLSGDKLRKRTPFHPKVTVPRTGTMVPSSESGLVSPLCLRSLPLCLKIITFVSFRLCGLLGYNLAVVRFLCYILLVFFSSAVFVFKLREP